MSYASQDPLLRTLPPGAAATRGCQGQLGQGVCCLPFPAWLGQKSCRLGRASLTIITIIIIVIIITIIIITIIIIAAALNLHKTRGTGAKERRLGGPTAEA